MKTNETTAPLSREQSRRHFLRLAGVGAAGCLAVPGLGLAADAPAPAGFTGAAAPQAKRLFHLGMASYSLRKFNLVQTIQMTQRLGLRYICLKSFHLPLDAKPEEITAATTKLKEAGLLLYGGGVIGMKTAADVEKGFAYAAAAGMKKIIAMPTADMLPLINQKVKQYDIAVCIHNHGPGDTFPTPADVYPKIKDLDKRIGLCNDIGHTVRAGADLIETTRQCADRLMDIHIKDVSAANAKALEVVIGHGVIDIPRFLATLIDLKYNGVVSFEHEPNPEDPMPGLGESVGYVRGVLAAIDGPEAS